VAPAKPRFLAISFEDAAINFTVHCTQLNLWIWRKVIAKVPLHRLLLKLKAAASQGRTQEWIQRIKTS